MNPLAFTPLFDFTVLHHSLFETLAILTVHHDHTRLFVSHLVRALASIRSTEKLLVCDSCWVCHGRDRVCKLLGNMITSGRFLFINDSSLVGMRIILNTRTTCSIASDKRTWSSISFNLSCRFRSLTMIIIDFCFWRCFAFFVTQSWDLEVTDLKLSQILHVLLYL